MFERVTYRPGGELTEGLPSALDSASQGSFTREVLKTANSDYDKGFVICGSGSRYKTVQGVISLDSGMDKLGPPGR